MFEIIVKTASGKEIENVICNDKKCFIGKDQGCLIVLHGWRVAKKHAQLEKKSDGIYIKDLSSTNSVTLVNGDRVDEYGPIVENDEIAIHSYRIKINNIEDGFVEEQMPANDITLGTPIEPYENRKKDAIKEVGNDDELTKKWQQKLHNELIQQMDLRRMNVNEMTDDELKKVSEELIQDISGKLEFPKELDKNEISSRVLSEAIGLGPLETLIEQDDISEIMVNSKDEIFYEKQGALYESEVTFSSDNAVTYAIERIVTPLGRRIDESSPMVDARLKDGSRVNAVIPPLALKGPCITIRKFMKEKLTAEHLIGFESATQDMMSFLKNVVQYKQNVIISGGTGSGKTTLLNVLSNFIPNNERIITIEDAAELKLYQPNLVNLEARPENQEGKGAITIRNLVINSLRMRPDRIVVGECRGGEAIDMLQAMNTGHDGSLTTVHANNPRDCVSRIKILVSMAGMDLPEAAILEQISSAVNIIVQQSRLSCGARKITSICEVTGIDSGEVQQGEIFRFKQDGFDKNGKTEGHFIATGLVPSFYESLSKRGIKVDVGIFEKDRIQK